MAITEPTPPEESASLSQLMKALEHSEAHFRETRATSEAARHAYTMAKNALNTLQGRIDRAVQASRNTAPDGSDWGHLPTQV